jgi:hypothetical protein
MQPPYAHRTQPEGYQIHKTLDLVKDKNLFILLNVVGIGLFITCWVLLGGLVRLVRPDLGAFEISFVLTLDQSGSFIRSLLVLLAVFFAMVTLHEAIHGLFFWLFTRSKVKFAFKGAYAYAAAPGWYLFKTPYMIVSLAPLVVMTLLGIVLMLILPLAWIPAVLLLVAMNAAGAIGDIYVFFLLLRMRGDVLVQDYGEKMDFFTRECEPSAG